MTPVSLAPVAPAVRGTDSHADAAKPADCDNFAAVLGRASGQRPDDDRSSTPIERKGNGAAKHARTSARAAAAKKHDTAPDTSKAATDAVPAEARRAGQPGAEGDIETDAPVDASEQRSTAEKEAAQTAPVVAGIAAVAGAPQAICAIATAAANSDEKAAASEAATSAKQAVEPNTARADAVKPATMGPAAANVMPDSQTAGPALAVADQHSEQPAFKANARETKDPLNDAAVEPLQDAPSSQAAVRIDLSRDIPASPSRPETAAPIVKSASWAAAASALREALQKSDAPSQEPTQAARPSPVTPPSANRIGQDAVVSLPVAAGQTAAGSKPGRASTDATDSVLEASGFAEAARVALTAAIGAQAREQSANSQADLGNGSSSSYKAPLKHTFPMPVFSVPAAFARTLESGAASATPALPPPFASTNLSSVGPQIVKGLQLQVTAGGGDMRLTLTPEHLGTVSIEVRVENDRVKATLMADTPAVRQWIATHQDDLRQRLEAAGLTLEDLVVKEDASQSRQEPQDERPAPQKRRAPRIDGDQQAFEVLA